MELTLGECQYRSCGRPTTRATVKYEYMFNKYCLDHRKAALSEAGSRSNGRRRTEDYVTSHGYRMVYRDGATSAVPEHTYVMEQHLGRKLVKGENVHHLNGDRLDNRIENLELWDTRQPAGQRVEDKLKFYAEFLREHGYNVSEPCDVGL